MISKKLSTLAFLFLYAMLCSLFAQDQHPSEKALPLDPSLRYGQLENGFTYYIKPIDQTGGKVNMELILKVGSKQEDSNQVAMAHFMEHLALVRTQHFTHILKNNELLEQLHMKARDIGGKTGGDETYYWFNYPAGNSEALGKGLLFFQDIVSGKIKFEKKDIQGERGAIFEEYLMGEGPKWYKEWKTLSLLSHCSKNIRRPEAYHHYINTFKVAPLKRFYQDWYRPDLMAISMIGEVKEVEAVEKEIIETFSKIPLPQKQRKGNQCEQEYLSRPHQFVSFNDVEDTPNGMEAPFYFQFFFRDHPHTGAMNMEKAEEELHKQILQQGFRQRLANAQTGYHIPYSFSFLEDFTVPAMKLKLKSPAGHAKEGVQKAFSVYKEWRRKGMDKDEFEKHKHQILTNLKQSNGQNPFYWKEKIHDHFVHQAPLSSSRYQHLQNNLTRLSVEEFNTWLKEYLPKTPDDIAVIVPKGKENHSFQEDSLRRWIAQSKADSQDNWKKAPQQLIPSKQLALIKPVQVVDKGTDQWGTHAYLLPNGLNLLLKPFQPGPGKYKNKIMLKGFAPIGASILREEKRFAALKAPEIIRHAGVGGWNKFQLQAYLKNTSLPTGVLPYINLYETGISTEVGLDELETALQLIYLYIKEPRRDQEAFLDWKQKEKESLHQTSSRAEFLGFVKKQVENTGQENRSGEAIDVQAAYTYYRALMQNPDKFTFMVTGAYRIEEVLPLLSRYLGNLPKSSKINDLTPEHLPVNSLPPRPYKKIYHPQKELMNVHIYQKFIKQKKTAISLQEEMEYDILAKVLDLQLRELRFEKKRAVYLALARSEMDKANQTMAINLMVSCSQEDFKKVQQDLKKMIVHLQEKGVEESLYREVMNAYILPKYAQRQPRKNKEMLKVLYEHYRFGEAFPQQQAIDNILNRLDKEELSRIAQKYLQEDYLMHFIAKSKAHP